jgi:hypothetical protein
MPVQRDDGRKFPGEIELSSNEVIVGSLYEPTEHVTIVVNQERRYALNTFIDRPPRLSRYTSTGFLFSFEEPLKAGDQVSVTVGGDQLLGSPYVYEVPSPPTDLDKSAIKIFVERPCGPIRNLLEKFSGWIVFHSPVFELEFRINDVVQMPEFYTRNDVVEALQGDLCLGWEFYCDTSRCQNPGSITLEIFLSGRHVYQQHFTRQRTPSSQKKYPLTFFMHIPKTAGVSVAKAMSSLPQNRTHWLYDRGRFPIAVQLGALSPDAFNELQLLGGHFVYGIHRRSNRSYRYVTILREPMAFLRSFFFYRKYVQRHPNFQTVDIYSAIEQKVDPYLDNCFVRCLATTAADAPVDQKEFEKAVNNMDRDFVFVGLVERMNETVAKFSSILGVDLPLLHENQTPLTNEARCLDVNVFNERVYEQSRFDRQLYLHARERFWSN